MSLSQIFIRKLQSFKDAFLPLIIEGEHIMFAHPYPYLKTFAIRENGQWVAVAQYHYCAPCFGSRGYSALQLGRFNKVEEATSMLQEMNIAGDASRRQTLLQGLHVLPNDIARIENLLATRKQATAPKR